MTEQCGEKIILLFHLALISKKEKKEIDQFLVVSQLPSFTKKELAHTVEPTRS